MAKGTTVDELFLSLGLDLTSLESDFITADSTVRTAMADLSRKQTQIKIRAEIDKANMGEAMNSMAELAMQNKSLNDQLAAQRDKVRLVDAEYKKSVATYGEANTASQRMLTNLLREQKAQAQLESQIKRTTAAHLAASKAQGAATVKQGGTMARSAMSIIPGMSGSEPAAVTNMAMTLGSLGPQGAIAGAAILGVGAVGTAMFEMTKKAAEAGNATVIMSERMGISFDEATDLSRKLSIAGVDADGFSQAMVRVGKSAISGVSGGNDMTRMLGALGVKLTDDNGHLLKVTDQVGLLGQAWEKAKSAGMEEEFAAGLGPKAAGALTEYLSQAKEIDELAKKAGPIIKINPEEARQAAQQLKLMDLQMKALETSAERALLPLANQLLPLVTTGFKNLADYIRDTVDALNSGANPAQKMMNILATPGTLLGQIHNKIKGGAVSNFLFGDSAVDNLNKDKPPDAPPKNPEMSEEEKGRLAEALAKKNVEVNAQTEATLYHLSHTRYENEVFDIQQKEKVLRDEGATAVTAARWADAELRKIESDRMKFAIDDNKKLEDSRLGVLRASGGNDVSVAQQQAADSAKWLEQYEQIEAINKRNQGDAYRPSDEYLQARVSVIQTQANYLKALTDQEDALGRFVLSSEKLAADANNIATLGGDDTVASFKAMTQAVKDYLSELQQIGKTNQDLAITGKKYQQVQTAGSLEEIKMMGETIPSAEKLMDAQRLANQLSVQHQMVSNEQLGAQQRVEIINQEAQTFKEFQQSVSSGIEDSMSRIQSLQSKAMSAGGSAVDTLRKYFGGKGVGEVEDMIDTAWNSTATHTQAQMSSLLDMKYNKHLNLKADVNLDEFLSATQNEVGGVPGAISDIQKNMDSLIKTSKDVGDSAAKAFFSDWDNQINEVNRRLNDAFAQTGGVNFRGVDPQGLANAAQGINTSNVYNINVPVTVNGSADPTVTQNNIVNEFKNALNRVIPNDTQRGS